MLQVIFRFKQLRLREVISHRRQTAIDGDGGRRQTQLWLPGQCRTNA